MKERVRRLWNRLTWRFTHPHDVPRHDNRVVVEIDSRAFYRLRGARYTILPGSERNRHGVKTVTMVRPGA